MRLFISTGEVSGDVVGSRLAAELYRRNPQLEIYGLGGSRMEAAGVRIEVATNHLGIVGVSESFSAIPAFLRALIRVRRSVRKNPPDAAILIGNDVFNVILGRWLRARGIRTIAYFPPQIWIWRSLAWLFARSYDMILTSFPEEQAVYERHCRASFYVGHYLCESLSEAPAEEREAARERFGVAAGERVIGLFPGSRRHEVRSLTPILLDAARQISSSHGAVRYLLPLCENSFRSDVEKELRKRGLAGTVTLADDSHDVMRASDLLLLASGTSTLEATLIGTPMVVAYRVSRLTIEIVRFCIRRGLIASETLALPNLVAGKTIVPELSQEGLSAREVAQQALRLLDSPDLLLSTRCHLPEVRQKLSRDGTLGYVSEMILEEAARSHGPAPVRTAGGSIRLEPLSTEVD